MSKKARTKEEARVEPVQAEVVKEVEMIDISSEAGPSSFESEVAITEDIPVDLDAQFAYLDQMKYNLVYLNGLTISQINEEYEKCISSQDRDGDHREFVVEPGEWTSLQESLNIDDLPPEELYHQNPEEMTTVDMRCHTLNFPQTGYPLGV
ncbi:hypothetical protein QVD17_16711 [Tagetes erecta]|uniref:Uncharacterized protein n=1 Tax=Tagetes erecta TaxID=13708 RepID=A0AAD8KS03_TARER|nr:hypothetical protein QVD17_16711 [Tagetes erecta]